jgi:hypothetical protein
MRIKMKKLQNMIYRNLAAMLLVFLFIAPALSQTRKSEQELKREVTLYNPYKPSLPEFNKRSFLPDMNDTVKMVPEINYEIITAPFRPEYQISQLKPASLLPDPLPKLYRSMVSLGLGNYNTPLAEVSISNTRSEKYAAGIYARHFSSNSDIKLDNGFRSFAGYMDNDASLFGKKFFRRSTLEASLDFSQKIRHAYGVDTSLFDYRPGSKDTRIGYNQAGINVGYASANRDSSKLFYNFDLDYNYFYESTSFYHHNPRLSGSLAKNYKGFYAGTDFEFDYYNLAPGLAVRSKYITSLNPHISRASGQWNFRLGLTALLERNLTNNARFHVYPDINFGFAIVPDYINFFSRLGGSLVKNTPSSVIEINPFIIPDGRIFNLPNTDNALSISGGLKGNTGINGNYVLSASYSVINDMLFYSNLFYPDTVFMFEGGNHFMVIPDDGEVINVHGEMSGRITDKLSFLAKTDFYSYNLSGQQYPWNRPSWTAGLGFKYNLRDKIIAGAEFTGIGSRKEIVTRDLTTPVPLIPSTIYTVPAHVNLNLSAEYRYTRILSFWVKLNNISYNRYYEWAFYPSQRFMGMIGFTYSL